MKKIKIPSPKGGLDYKKKLLYAAATMAGSIESPSKENFQEKLVQNDGDHISAAMDCFELDKNDESLRETLVFLEECA